MVFRKKQNLRFLFIFTGVLLVGLREVIFLIYPPFQIITVFTGFLFIGISFIGNKNGEKVSLNLNANIKSIFILYLGIIVNIIIRPLILGESYTVLSYHPYYPYGIYSFLLPSIVFFVLDQNSLKFLFKTIFISSLIGIIYFILSLSYLKDSFEASISSGNDGEMSIPAIAEKYYYWFSISSLTFLCYEFVPILYKRMSIVVVFFLFFLLAFLGRRSFLFMSVLYFLGGLYLYFYQTGNKNQLLKMIFMLVLSLITIYVLQDKFSDFLIFDRLTDDTRSDVDFTLINYLSKENAWLLGKGIDGAYSHYAFDGLRNTHETGYLYLILKGGLIYLTLYVFLLSYSAYLGFYKTRNRFTKATAIFVFCHVIYLIPFGVPNFGLEYLCLWICFFVCQSTKWRSLSNSQIKQLIKH